MLRCQSCGSRAAAWEWCSRCGNPDPFARFRRARLVAVLLILVAALFLALLAHQKTRSLDWAGHRLDAPPQHVAPAVRRAGI